MVPRTRNARPRAIQGIRSRLLGRVVFQACPSNEAGRSACTHGAARDSVARLARRTVMAGVRRAGMRVAGAAAGGGALPAAAAAGDRGGSRRVGTGPAEGE